METFCSVLIVGSAVGWLAVRLHASLKATGGAGCEGCGGRCRGACTKNPVFPPGKENRPNQNNNRKIPAVETSSPKRLAKQKS